MRFYSSFALFLDGQNWKEFANVWKKTSGYFMKIILSCTMVFFINLVFLVLVAGIISNSHSMPVWLYNVYAEFIFYLMNYFVIVSLVNFFETQRKTFLG